MKDKIGQEIFKGAHIVYGHAGGRCAMLRVGVVLDVTEATGAKGPRIKVQGIDAEWSHEPPRLRPKPSTLHFPNRIVVISKCAVWNDRIVDCITQAHARHF